MYRVHTQFYKLRIECVPSTLFFAVHIATYEVVKLRQPKTKSKGKEDCYENEVLFH